MMGRSDTNRLGVLLRRVNLPGIAVICLLIVVWQIYSRTLGAHFDSIASSSQILVAIKNLALGGPLAQQLAHTTSVALIGWAIASALGFVIGLPIGLWRPAWTYTMASIDVLRSIPSISFVAIAVLLFGFSADTEMVIVVYVSLWPLLMGTLGGIRTVPGDLLDVARSFKLSRTATVFKIVMPAALPSIIVGLRLSLTLSIALAVVAEMVGNPDGLGFGMVMAQQAIKPADAFAYLVVIGILGWGLNAIFVFAVRRLFRGHGSIV
jgi:NitT/TauT family transport system permease protein